MCSSDLKGDIVAYYQEIAPLIIPYLVDRPQSLNRHPHGVHGESFFHKNMVGYLPPWIQTHKVSSKSSGRSINYLLCQDKESLLYMINMGCIELNPWLSRVGSLEYPDFCVIDLDPDDNPFSQVVEVALKTHEILNHLSIPNFCKTSGATGLHIVIPLTPNTPFEESRLFAWSVVQKIQKIFPRITSIERTPSKRRHKIYLDFLQNRKSQTLAAPYCIRPRKLATVSTPLAWSELTPSLHPSAFNLRTISQRIAEKGDLWQETIKIQGVELKNFVESSALKDD